MERGVSEGLRFAPESEMIQYAVPVSVDIFKVLYEPGRRDHEKGGPVTRQSHTTMRPLFTGPAAKTRRMRDQTQSLPA